MDTAAADLLDQASGAAGDTIWSHNGSGQYTRPRVGVTQTNTTPAIAARSRLATLMTYWRTSMTEAQRADWDTAARRFPVRGRLGRTIVLDGRRYYTRVNAPRLLAGKTIIPGPPVPTPFTVLKPVTIAQVQAARIFIAFDNTDAWAIHAGGVLLCFVSPPQRSTHNFHATPYLFRGQVNGATTPPTSPKIIGVNGSPSVGQRVFVKCYAVDREGKISFPQVIHGDRTS